MLVAACHKANAPQPVTAQDLQAAQQEAKREVADARAEASKDVKSAAKVSGSDAAVVSAAKATAAYDVATEQCLTLQADMQQACKDQADAAYQSTAAAAKGARMAKRQ